VLIVGVACVFASLVVIETRLGELIRGVKLAAVGLCLFEESGRTSAHFSQVQDRTATREE
jgi:hypothetical protein